MVAAAGAAERVEETDRFLRDPRFNDSRRIRGEDSGFAAAEVCIKESPSGTSSGTDTGWPACVAGGLKSTQT